MTVSQIKEQGYKLHHTSWTRGYISRKNWNKENALANEYDGKFGTGFTVLSPSWESTNYCYISYYTK